MSAPDRITAYIDELGDWRGALVARIRKVVGAAAPELAEGFKWNTPVWTGRGNVLAVGAFKDHVKINFFRGASLEDPRGLFNAGLDAKASRALDIGQGERLDEAGLAQLVRAAAAQDRKSPKPKTKGSR